MTTEHRIEKLCDIDRKNLEIIKNLDSQVQTLRELVTTLSEAMLELTEKLSEGLVEFR